MLRITKMQGVSQKFCSVVINFKVKLRVKTGNKYEKRKMVNIFQNPKWKQEYAIEILENLDNEDSMDNNINEK
jgi:hypothetical protein